MDKTAVQLSNMACGLCKGLLLVAMVIVSMDRHCLGYTVGKNDMLSIDAGGLLESSNKATVLRHSEHNTVFSTDSGHDRVCSQTDEPAAQPEVIHVDNSRLKRDLSSYPEKFMEVLIVTDNSVVNFHGRSFLEQYILTQMNIVDAAYHHPTLHIEINIIVSDIVIVDDRTAEGLVVRGDGKRTLDRFCAWANRHRHKDPYYEKTFDVALFVTRKDIGPAGYAPVTGMCHPHRSCAVNKDAGVSSAYVITHEIGHILGMVHDGHGNRCDREAEDGKVMASTVQANYENVHWTECSRRALEQHIGSLHCLNEKPKAVDWPDYAQPYGVAWTLDEQCRQEFGEGYKLCSVFTNMDMCDMMWCSSDSEAYMCKTKRSPPLPGSPCGHNMWCMDRKCRQKDDKEAAVDGGWTHWSDWSECSRTCSVGVQYKYRRCTNPTPQHGGQDCTGSNEKFQLCNKQACKDVGDIRAEQCSAHDHTNFLEDQRHTWIPAPTTDDDCKLHCISLQTGVTFVSEKPVVDGTPCSYDKPDDICIKGKCYALGCDKQFGSSKKSDKCGVCGGDGLSCKTVSATFDAVLPRKQYHKMLYLPLNARDIVIKEERGAPHLAHFLAVRGKEDELLINGKEHQGESKEFIAQGAKFTYDGSGAETLTSNGPLLGPVPILVYSLSNKLATSIHYEYTIPLDMVNDVALQLYAEVYSYVWHDKGWSECSRTCNTGSRSEVYVCVGKNNQDTVADTLCKRTDKPNITTEECNKEPCFINTYSWSTDPWSSCSATCGRDILRTRVLKCFVVNLYGTGKDWQVEESLCHEDEKPHNTERCDVRPCEQVWVVGEWSQCSETCGYGVQKRTVQCGIEKHDMNECSGKEPNSLRLCKQPRCEDVLKALTTSTTTTETMPQTSSPTTLATTTPETMPQTSSPTTLATTTPETMPQTSSPTTLATTTPETSTASTSSTTTGTTTARTPSTTDTTTYKSTHTSTIANDISQSYHNERDNHNNVLKHKYTDNNNENAIWDRLRDNRYNNQGHLLSPHSAHHGQKIRPDTNSIKVHINNEIPPTPTPVYHTMSKKLHNKNMNSVPARNSHGKCSKDMSFFCIKNLDSKKCILPLYQKYCCETCKRILQI